MEAEYEVPTEIQRETIGLALQGKDVLGAAKTGSGKTLAFLIPVLECLYRNRYSSIDGLGALVISPTRELAYQTFEVLCKIGKKHDFSAGLVIGGKNLREETDKIRNTNIIVCTPGRLLQHMDETSYFECNNLLMLVLDEADRILDLGFEKTMNAIIENLPSERQTLLFSATQTKSVRDLARLSLKDPKYVAVHQHHEHSTPVQLEQSYVVCELDHKLNMLYSFIRNHLKKKILVFMASCKQVKYVYETFCRLRPGTTVMALYGKLHQLRRVAIYKEFCQKENAVLIATDLAARGLDFPAVNWVIQLDCPEDVNTYIHRAGRTARYKEDGESLLVLLPSEEKKMLTELLERKIPIEQIRVNPEKLIQIQAKLESMCAKNLELKQSAQRCFISYLRSVYLMSNKDVFDIQKLPTDKFAHSLGLAIAPRIRFLKKAEKIKEKQKSGKGGDEAEQTVEGAVESDDEDDQDKQDESSNLDEDKMAVSEPLTSEAAWGKDSWHNQADDDDDDDDDDDENDFLTVKTRDVFGMKSQNNDEDDESSDEEEEDEIADDKVQEKTEDVGMTKPEVKTTEQTNTPVSSDKTNKKGKALTRAAMAKKLARKKYKVNKKVVFGEEGEIVEQFPPVQRTIVEDQDDDEGGIDIEKTKNLMEAEDQYDKQVFKQRVKEKRRLEKEKRRKERGHQRRRGLDSDEDGGVRLAVDESESSDVDMSNDPDRFESSSDDEIRERGDDSDDDNDDTSDDDSEECIRPAKKQKTERRHKSTKSRDLLKKSDLSLQDEEELALQLLSNRR
ncbi:probable ATP-dependent RNA helicase DDX10 isoform X2 [Ptychodera flava]